MYCVEEEVLKHSHVFKAESRLNLALFPPMSRNFLKLGGTCLAQLSSSSVWMNEEELTTWLKIDRGFSVGRNQ